MSVTIPSHLTDGDLMVAVAGLAGEEREVVARFIAYLAEVDCRQLCVPAGYSSLYIYCREGLGYSEDAAYNRKVAEQVARRYPVIVDMLADGRLSLTTVRLLAPVLTEANHRDAFAAAARKSKREVERLVARLEPKPDVPSTIRKLPTPMAAVPERESAAPLRTAAAEVSGQGTISGTRPALVSAASGKRPVVAPLAPERYRVQFTIGEETEKKLRRVQELLKREIPNGDPAAIFDRALALLLAKVETRKHGLTAKPRTRGAGRPGSRHMPAATRRQVMRRDAGQCAFVGTNGRRCAERAYVEYHHARIPFAHGGGPEVDNITLHCRRHNADEGKRIFGPHLPREVREARAQYEALWSRVPERGVGPDV